MSQYILALFSNFKLHALPTPQQIKIIHPQKNSIMKYFLF